MKLHLKHSLVDKIYLFSLLMQHIIHMWHISSLQKYVNF